MIVNFLFLASIITIILLSTFLIYNVICFIINRYFRGIYTDNQMKRINTYKSNSIYLSGVLIAVFIFITVYFRPVSFYKMIDIDENIQLNVVNIWGNITGESNISLDSDDASKLINILERYNYKRTFATNSIGGNGEFITLGYDDSVYMLIEIWEKGYIRIPNHKVYKIDSKDREELYNLFKKEIREFEL